MTTPTEPPYHDRREAGRVLGRHVTNAIGVARETVVLALPRGGVPVGLEVARTLRAPLDVLVVRKLGVPGHEEFAMGAIAAGGFQVLNEDTIARLGISDRMIAEVVRREAKELKRREKLYRGRRPPVNVAQHTVVLVDDGLATGFTMRAAVTALRGQKPKKLIVAVPVGAAETCAELEREVDALICPLQPLHFSAVGSWYHDFDPTTDAEVRACLAEAAQGADA